MDQDDDYSKTRDELLGNFRQSLSKPMSERFFDEDDLIEIFDYAGDLNDDYLRMEALMCGARYFPDSPELLERRAIFYSDFSPETRDNFLTDNRVNNSMIFDIMALRAELEDVTDVLSANPLLDELIKRYNSWNDEETIQFVNAIVDLKAYDWLKENFKTLRQKVQYQTTLLYETANASEIYSDYGFGISLMEELVEKEPFNFYFWLLLARLYSLNGDAQKALSAINYAQAIAPEQPQVALTKAKIMFAADQPHSEIEKSLESALNIKDIESLKFMASLKISEGKNDEAKKLLKEVYDFGGQAAELEIIPDLLLLDEKHADYYFDRYYQLSDNNTPVSWLSWAQQLSIQGFPLLARKAIAAFERNSGQTIPSTIKAEDDFIKQDFESVNDDVAFFLSNVENAEADFPILMVMDVLSLLKKGEIAKAYALCDYFNRNVDIERYPALSTRLEFIGMKTIIINIMTLIEDNKRSPFWDDFDPLGLWNDLPKD